MSMHSRILLFAAGLTIWIAGSIYYAYQGPQVLETTRLHYWISFFASVLSSVVLALAVFKLLRIEPPYWASAALLLTVPGMIGEAIVLSHLSTFMPRIQESSGGRYGAFLFASYAAVLAIAEIVTLNAAS